MKQRISPLAIVASALFLLGAAWSAWQAVHSPAFALRQVEWPGYPADAPLPLPNAVQLAAIPIERQRLVTLELGSIEKRLLSHPWVKSVRVERKLPDTLAIHVRFREPVALLETGAGKLAYVEASGEVFRAPASEGRASDLLLLHGVKSEEPARILEMMEIAGKFRKSASFAEVSGIDWEEGRGYRVLLRYQPKTGAASRTIVEIGESASDPALEEGLPRVQQVLDYLSARSLSPRAVLMGDGKKIVVRIAQGS